MTSRLVFIDESIRSNRYLLCALTVHGSDAGQLRREVRGMLLAGQRRLHFKLEGKRRRRVLLDQLVALGLDVALVQSRITSGRTPEDARADCLALMVEQAQAGGQGATLYIEGRDGLDRTDRETIVRARRPEPALNFEHLRPHGDPLLWVPARNADVASSKRDAAIREAHRAGASLREIAAESGISHTSVKRIIERSPD